MRRCASVAGKSPAFVWTWQGQRSRLLRRQQNVCEGFNRWLWQNTAITPICHVFSVLFSLGPRKKLKIRFNVKKLTGRATNEVEWEIAKKCWECWECCMCGMCSERKVDGAGLPAYSSSRGGRIYSRPCHVQPGPSEPTHPCRPGWFLPPQDTLTFPPNRKRGREEEQWTEREGAAEGWYNILGSPERRQSTVCLERNQSPQLFSDGTARPRLSSSSCRLSPSPVPREFPEKQGCQQRQNRAGRELGCLALSSPLTAHQLTGRGVISHQSSIWLPLSLESVL